MKTKDRIARIDAQLDELLRHFDCIGNRLDGIGNRLDGIKTSLDGIEIPTGWHRKESLTKSNRPFVITAVGLILVWLGIAIAKANGWA